ncbi:Flp family type IVb pilin [Pseudomonas sp. REP124]|uniref:Flp family type IVb pilin n=1 Tax=Pseudomonas sp. REP124 TaxID=2875731 RepID=UPI001CCDF7BB|nr:Flp family type IVb pilin [Pseudomonas sp. REP124]MBZ9782625.1 Flp family type IVb pilin [Pseudomonas sp. REP124]
MSFSKLVSKVKSELVLSFCRRLARDTEGASGIEYAIVAAMVAVVIAGLSSGIAGDIGTVFGKISGALVPKSS